jgi:hypothetical protein
VAGIATSRMIGQILQVLRDGSPCSRDRHRHSGPSYTFGIEVLQAHVAERDHPAWRLAIVSERWWAGDSDVLIRDTAWLKLISGKAADVAAWLKRAQR